jgi:hypothetical protein
MIEAAQTAGLMQRPQQMIGRSFSGYTHESEMRLGPKPIVESRPDAKDTI